MILWLQKEDDKNIFFCNIDLLTSWRAQELGNKKVVIPYGIQIASLKDNGDLMGQSHLHFSTAEHSNFYFKNLITKKTFFLNQYAGLFDYA